MVAEFAAALAGEGDARAVLFYGSNLRTGSLEGVLDFYVLLPGTAEGEAAIWPRVSYHERPHGDDTLRAKVATMRLATFARAAGGTLTDTTIWARFVQPSALVWAADESGPRRGDRRHRRCLHHCGPTGGSARAGQRHARGLLARAVPCDLCGRIPGRERRARE